MTASVVCGRHERTERGFRAPCGTRQRRTARLSHGVCIRWITLLAVALLSTGFAQADSASAPAWESLFPHLASGQLAALQAKGVVRSEDGSWSLCPDVTLVTGAKPTWTQSELPAYIAENLYLVKKAALVENSAHKADADTSMDAVWKIIHAVSKMQGMKYYSNSDKKWAVLYDEAHLVDAPDTKRRIDDTTDGKRLYCLLKDHTFGRGIYRMEYENQSGDEVPSVSLCFTNETPLKVLGVTGVKSQYMKINLVVMDCDALEGGIGDGSYAVYMAVQARYPKVALLENTLRRSFYARLDAIYNWFVHQF